MGQKDNAKVQWVNANHSINRIPLGRDIPIRFEGDYFIGNFSKIPQERGLTLWINGMRKTLPQSEFFNDVEWLEETPIDDKIEYLYFQVDVYDCPVNWNTTFCENLDEVKKVLEYLEVYFDDPKRNTKATISGIGMTRAAYAEVRIEIDKNNRP